MSFIYLHRNIGSCLILSQTVGPSTSLLFTPGIASLVPCKCFGAATLATSNMANGHRLWKALHCPSLAHTNQWRLSKIPDQSISQPYLMPQISTWPFCVQNRCSSAELQVSNAYIERNTFLKNGDLPNPIIWVIETRSIPEPDNCGPSCCC